MRSLLGSLPRCEMLDMAAVRFEQIEQAGVCVIAIVVTGATVSGPGRQLGISSSRFLKQRTRELR